MGGALIMADNNKIWGLLMFILSVVCTVAIAFAGLGYQSNDKRLISIEKKIDCYGPRLMALEYYQDDRLIKEGKQPRRPPTEVRDNN